MSFPCKRVTGVMRLQDIPLLTAGVFYCNLWPNVSAEIDDSHENT